MSSHAPHANGFNGAKSTSRKERNGKSTFKYSNPELAEAISNLNIQRSRVDAATTGFTKVGEKAAGIIGRRAVTPVIRCASAACRFAADAADLGLEIVKAVADGVSVESAPTLKDTQKAFDELAE